MWRGLAAILLWLAAPLAAQDFTTFKGHGGPVMGLDVAPGGQLASASFDNSAGLWRGGAPVWLDGHDAAVVVVRFDGDQHMLTGGDDFRVLRWTLGQPTPQEITRHLGKVSDIAVDPRDGRIASAGWDGFIQISQPDGASDPETLRGHQSNVTDVGFDATGRLYSASSDGTLRVWSHSDTGWSNRVIVRHGFGINTMIIGDGWIAYGAVDGGTRVIDPETGRQIRDFTLDRRPILAMDYHPASQQLSVGDGHGYIMMIDTDRWRIARDFRAMRQGPVWALAFSGDGTVIHAGGIDDVIYAWPVALLNEFDPVGEGRSFLRDAASMPNGERQFMRKCSICHALDDGPSRKAGPTLYGLFGRQAGTVPGYRYSARLTGSDIIWTDDTVDALFDIGPDHYIPGSKMPMQVIARPEDRADLVAYLRRVTAKQGGSE